MCPNSEDPRNQLRNGAIFDMFTNSAWALYNAYAASKIIADQGGENPGFDDDDLVPLVLNIVAFCTAIYSISTDRRRIADIPPRDMPTAMQIANIQDPAERQAAEERDQQAETGWKRATSSEFLQDLAPLAVSGASVIATEIHDRMVRDSPARERELSVFVTVFIVALTASKGTLCNIATQSPTYDELAMDGDDVENEAVLDPQPLPGNNVEDAIAVNLEPIAAIEVEHI